MLTIFIDWDDASLKADYFAVPALGQTNFWLALHFIFLCYGVGGSRFKVSYVF